MFSCDTPATHSKLQKEPRRGCSYTLERGGGGVVFAPPSYREWTFQASHPRRPSCCGDRHLQAGLSKQGSTPTPWARGLPDQSKNGRSRPRKPFISRASVLRGGLRPWYETMVSEGARPWGRGRSGDCEGLKFQARLNISSEISFSFQASGFQGNGQKGCLEAGFFSHSFS